MAIDRLAEIISNYDRFAVGLDDTLWLIREVQRLRAEQIRAVGKLKGTEGWPRTDDLCALIDHITYQRRGAITELAEIHDTLANALGYQKAPTLEEDPNCPCPGAYATGDHTAASLAAEAAKKLRPGNMNYAGPMAAERALQKAVDQIVKLQCELADLRRTKKAELRREIEALRFKCNCPYNTDFSCLDRNTKCPTHGDEAYDKRLAGEKALNTLAYVRKYFMGSEHGHEV
jgi:hypothetical protein